MELTDRQTLRRLLEKNGFRFSKAKGQNFLTAAWVPDRIAAESGITEEDGVLEIGPGVGVLTTRLARQAAAVAAVELDRTLEPVLAETLEGLDNVAVVYADALKTDLKALCREKLGDRPWKVCANLPYNVTKSLITAFLEAGCFETVTVMVQREVAGACAPARYGGVRGLHSAGGLVRPGGGPFRCAAGMFRAPAGRGKHRGTADSPSGAPCCGGGQGLFLPGGACRFRPAAQDPSKRPVCGDAGTEPGPRWSGPWPGWGWMAESGERPCPWSSLPPWPTPYMQVR